MKTMQDAVLLHRVGDVAGKQILEVGGGHSRVLGALCRRNECTNADPLEGEHGGPRRRRLISRHHFAPYRQVFAKIGRSAGVLVDQSFDLVFSISVVEHLGLGELDGFFADIARILRPGGRTVHLIDTYLGLDSEINAEPLARFRAYRRVFTTGQFRPFKPADVIEEAEVCFHPRLASNPDNVMNEWNRVAPTLKLFHS
jgi:SAM-dependent methyltransferase